MSKTKENTYDKKIAPLLDKLVSLCEENDMPMLVAVQLFTGKKGEGARVAAQSVETEDISLHLSLSSKILRGEAKLIVQNDHNILISLSDAEIEDTETLAEHSAHCTDCRESMEERIAKGEDISNIRVAKKDDDLRYIFTKSKNIH